MPVFEFPFRNYLTTGTGLTNNTVTLSANGDFCAFIFAAEQSISAKKIGFRTGSVTVTGKTIEFSIQAVSSDGQPTGTNLISGTTTTAPASNAWYEFTFSSTLTLSKGSVYAIVVKANDAGWSGNLIINCQVGGCESGVFPYIASKEAGAAATKQSNRSLETFYVIDNSGSPTVYGWPFDVDSQTVAIGINPDEAGMQFVIPTTSCSTYKVTGLRFATNTTINASAPDIGIALYNWNNGNYETALETTVFPVRNQSLTSAAIGIYEYYFDNPPILNAGSKYVASVYTTDPSFTTTALTTMRGMNITDTLKPAMWDQTNGYEWNRVSRATTTDNWSTTSNSTLAMSLICEIVSLPSGGGLLVHPGMAGGMRG